jgi:hypothetical protein
MRSALFFLVAACATLGAARADASPKKAKSTARTIDTSPKPWCAPEVSELSDHTCWFDGGAPADGRRTLVVYLHGAYATTPGFQHLQQKALAMMATRHSFTLLLPTSPKTEALRVGHVRRRRTTSRRPRTSRVEEGSSNARLKFDGPSWSVLERRVLRLARAAFGDRRRRLHVLRAAPAG